MKRKAHKFKVALVQMDVGSDRNKNLSKARSLILKAASKGANVICLPELFSYMGSFSKPNDAAETKSGISLKLIKKLALQTKTYIVGGSILIKSKTGLPKNTCFTVNPQGKVISSYSKVHPFDINVSGKIRFEESKYMSVGKSAVTLKTPFGTFGFAICNDIRYPELFRKMVLAGAEVIFLPAAFTKFTGRKHWIALNKVRAIENQCYVVAVNQCGKNVEGVRFFGSSLVADPWGNIVKEIKTSKDGIAICSIDLSLVKKFRKELPSLKKIRRHYPLKKYHS